MHTNTCMEPMILKQSMLNLWQKILIRIQSKFHLTNILMGYWVRPSIKTKCFIGKVDKFPSFNIRKLWEKKGCQLLKLLKRQLLRKFYCSEVLRSLAEMPTLPPCSLKKCWKTAGRCNVLLWVIQQWDECHRDRKIFGFLSGVQSYMT